MADADSSGFGIAPSASRCSSSASNFTITSCFDDRFTLAHTANPSLGNVMFVTCYDAVSYAILSTIPVYALPVYVKYQASDLPVLQTAPGPGSDETAPPDSTTSLRQGDLSQDAKIAIGVTVPFIPLSFLLGVLVAMRWRRKFQHRPQGLEDIAKPELHGHSATVSNRPAYHPEQGSCNLTLEGYRMHEMDAIHAQRPAELRGHPGNEG